MYICRYVGSDGCIQDLVDFIECDEGVTGQAIADKILGKPSCYGLDCSQLRGQGYDGAGNMSGKTKGTAAIITKKYPLGLPQPGHGLVIEQYWWAVIYSYMISINI